MVSHTVHLIRHAQGHHNLTPLNHSMPDPTLTPLGLSQCYALGDSFPYTPLITHIVASPLRRTLYTALESFPTLVQPPRNLKVIALPEIQETSDLPCDTGSALEVLQKEFAEGGEGEKWAGCIDLSLVAPGWNDKSSGTDWAPDKTSVEARAHKARLYLRDLANKYERDTGNEAHVVVVTHGGLLHFLTEDWCGFNAVAGTGWANTEFRSYNFKSPEESVREGVDMASMEEKPESLKMREGKEKSLTADEEREARAVGADVDLQPTVEDEV